MVWTARGILWWTTVLIILEAMPQRGKLGLRGGRKEISMLGVQGNLGSAALFLGLASATAQGATGGGRRGEEGSAAGLSADPGVGVEEGGSLAWSGDGDDFDNGDGDDDAEDQGASAQFGDDEEEMHLATRPGWGKGPHEGEASWSGWGQHETWSRDAQNLQHPARPHAVDGDGGGGEQQQQQQQQDEVSLKGEEGGVQERVAAASQEEGLRLEVPTEPLPNRPVYVGPASRIKGYVEEDKGPPQHSPQAPIPSMEDEWEWEPPIVTHNHIRGLTRYATKEVGMANKLMFTGNFTVPRDICYKILKKYPEHAPCLTVVARLYLMLGEKLLARKVARGAIDADPNFKDSYILLAELLEIQGTEFLANGDAESAYESYRRILLMDESTHRKILARSTISQSFYSIAVILQVLMPPTLTLSHFCSIPCATSPFLSLSISPSLPLTLFLLLPLPHFLPLSHTLTFFSHSFAFSIPLSSTNPLRKCTSLWK